jgi:hypothetical protein
MKNESKTVNIRSRSDKFYRAIVVVTLEYILIKHNK